MSIVSGPQGARASQHLKPFHAFQKWIKVFFIVEINEKKERRI
jgi:hypothetical protein